MRKEFQRQVEEKGSGDLATACGPNSHSSVRVEPGIGRLGNQFQGLAGEWIPQQDKPQFFMKALFFFSW